MIEQFKTYQINNRLMYDDYGAEDEHDKIFIPLWNVIRKDSCIGTTYWFGFYMDKTLYNIIPKSDISILGLLRDLLMKEQFSSFNSRKDACICLKALSTTFLTTSTVYENKTKQIIFSDIDFVKELSYEEAISVYADSTKDYSLLWKIKSSEL